ncbi:unnamed protein product [Didymodactylos carnosus]|uniref:PH domain-containing protein n=1 Tax=Didymodactylos carnosus TaxID=1234261 RepID=A0A8S2CVV0_9BILA|nr:unnamed protein product [Didymodactylos carnosus]CAF3600849.1 unnamed protein product [Didymodactylos carnosus]
MSKNTIHIRCAVSMSSLARLNHTGTTNMSTATSDYYIAPPSLNILSDQSCSFCSRPLYSFEQVLICNLCHSAYHWRCVKPDLSYYGDDEIFTCQDCTVKDAGRTSITYKSSHNTTTNALRKQHDDQRYSSPRTTLGTGIKIKSPESDTDYKEFVGAPNNKKASAANSVTDAVKYFEEKQLNVYEPQQKQQHRSYDDLSKKYNHYHEQQPYSNGYSYSSSEKNTSIENLAKNVAQSSILESYTQLRNNSHNDDKIPQYRTITNESEMYNGKGKNYTDGVDGLNVQKHRPLYDDYDDEVDNENYSRRRDLYNFEKENDEAATFRAKYQYTPLQDYAKNLDEDTNIESSALAAMAGAAHSLSSTTNETAVRYPTYNSSSHEYNPVMTRLVDLPVLPSTSSVDKISKHNQPQIYVSATNVSLNGTNDQNRIENIRSMPISKYDTNSSYHRQQNINSNSNTALSALVRSTPLVGGGDQASSIVDSDSALGTIVSVNGNGDQGVMERKLSDMLSKLGKQLETESQLVNAKLEQKLKNLEEMINQQTYIIRRQDEVIERLKTKISRIETERDSFRDKLNERDGYGSADRGQHDKSSNDSISITTESQKTSPFYDRDLRNKLQDPKSVENDYQTIDHRLGISSVDNFGSSVYDKKATVADTQHGRLSAKKPAPVATKQEWLTRNESSEKLHNGSEEQIGSVKVQKQKPEQRLKNLITHDNDSLSSHTKDNWQSSEKSEYNRAVIHEKPDNREPISVQQVLTSIHHADSTGPHQDESRRSRQNTESSTTSEVVNIQSKNDRLNQRTSNLRRSFDSIPQQQQLAKIDKYQEKTRSLEFGTRPMMNDESIYVRVDQQPASRYSHALQGYLQRKNLDSFFKRTERYYCVLSNEVLLLYKRETDRAQHKALMLRGARATPFDDPKYIHAFELTWTNMEKPKRYHFYAQKAEDVTKWCEQINEVAGKVLPIHR